MQKYKSNITTTSGAAVRGAPVHVLAEDGSPASIFLDRAGTVQAANPLSTASDGTFYFYAENGRYSLRTTVDGVTITDADVALLWDPAEVLLSGPLAEAVERAEASAAQAEAAVADSGIVDLVASAQNAVVDAQLALAEASGLGQAAQEAEDAAASAVLASQVATDAANLAVDAAQDAILASAASIKAYATHAEASIAAALLPDGADVEVAQDETRAGARTRYKVQAGALVFVVNLDQVRLDLANAADPAKGAGMVGYMPAGVGAVATTVQSKLREVVSVKDFGAVGDGVADDTAAIQLAIDSNPGRLYFPTGTYIASSVTVANNLVICGDGDASVVKRKAAIDTNSPSPLTAALFSITAHDIKVAVQDICLDGNEANQIAYEPYGYLLRFTNVTGAATSKLALICNNVTFQNATQCCIWADGDTASAGLEELTVTNCRFINGRHGLAQGDVNVLSASGYGPDYIVLTDKVYATISGSSFVFDKTLSSGQFSRTAVRLTFNANTANADGARAVIDGNYFYGCGRGERADGNRPGNDVGVIDAYARGRELRIVNNLFEQSQGAPIRGKTNCDLVNIMGNVIDSTEKNPGINIGPNSYAQQVGRISISNNTVRNTAGFAIGVVGNAGATTSGPANTQRYVADVLISDNVIEGVASWDMQLGPTVGEGIYVRNFRNANVTGNMIGSVALNGIWARGTGGTYSLAHLNISNNRVEVAEKGVALEPSIVGAVTVSGNTVVAATSWGFDIQALPGGGASLNYTSNSCIGSGGHGHYFRNWAWAHIIGNHVEEVTGVSRGFYPQDSLNTKLAFNSVGAGVTTPLVGGGSGQSVNHDFGNTWNPKVMYGSAAPAAGTWVRGDTVYVASPTAGGNIGFVCVGAGTPGTWKTFGAIAA